MKEDEPGLSDQDKRVIEAIRRELDREFGDDYPKATIHPERPDRRATRRHTGLAVGLGFLAVVALATAAVVASWVLAPVPYANLRESAAISSVDSQSGSESPGLIERQGRASGLFETMPVSFLPRHPQTVGFP